MTNRHGSDKWDTESGVMVTITMVMTMAVVVVQEMQYDDTAGADADCCCCCSASRSTRDTTDRTSDHRATVSECGTLQSKSDSATPPRTLRMTPLFLLLFLIFENKKTHKNGWLQFLRPITGPLFPFLFSCFIRRRFVFGCQHP